MKQLLLFVLFALSLSFTSNTSRAQSPGGVGTTNLTAWWNPDVLPLGNASSWTTVYPSGPSAITLTKTGAPYAQVTSTPTNNTSNYNRTIDFTGNVATAAGSMALENTGSLNLLDNNLNTAQGTFFAVYHMTNATSGQHIVDYRELSGDAIQFRKLANMRYATTISNSVNATRDFPDDGKPFLMNAQGNKSTATSLKLRLRSADWTGAGVASSASTGGQLGLTVGMRKANPTSFTGPFQSFLSELIFFNTDLSFSDLVKVESYLGIKYGITLDPMSASSGAYASSTTLPVWNASGIPSYHNDVIGIARDDVSALQQKQSHSYDDSVRLYLSTLAVDNFSNTGSFTSNISYLMMGHNNGQLTETSAATSEMPTGQSLLNRIEREWRVTNTNLGDTYSMDIKLNSFTNFSNNPASLCLLVDDDGNFSNATVYQIGLTFSVNGNTVTVSGIGTTQIPLNSTRFITLATKAIVINIPIAGTAFSNQNVVCAGDSVHLSLVGTSTFSGQSYQWQESPNGTSFTNIGGATLDTLNIVPAANTYYQCIVSLGASQSTSSNVFITVNPLPTVIATPSATTVCNGASVTLNGGGINSAPVTVVLNATKDNSIYSGFTGNSNGAGIYLVPGRSGQSSNNRSLLAFDFSSIPPGATITGATLQLNCSATGSSASEPISLHTMTQNWGEGTSNASTSGTGIAATTNDATWLNAFHPSTPWTTAGGVFAATPSATTLVPSTGVYTWNTIGTVADVQTWYTTPATNFGWMIKGQETADFQARRFDSRENSTVANRPKLTVTYTLPAATYTWTGGVTNNTAFAPTATTTYTVTGVDANTCSNTATSVVTVNPLPTVTATPTATTVCSGANVTLAGGGASTYTWTGGITDNTPFAATTTTTYTVTGVDANTCSNTATSVVTVNPLPSVTATPSTTTVCNSSYVSLSGGGASTYAWTGGITDNTPFSATATTTYTVTGTDASTCTNTATAVVTVGALSGILAQATATNAASVAGNAAQTANQPDGSVLSYFDASCNLIATVNDGAGGNILGNVTSTVNVDATVQVYNTQPYTRRWYDIVPTSNGAAIVTLYQTQADFDDYNVYAGASLPTWPLLPTGPLDLAGIANVRISKISGGGLGVGTATTITPTSVVWSGAPDNRWAITFPVTGFSLFYTHAANPNNAALPVTITEFSGEVANTTNLIHWTSAQEHNSQYYTLEYSTDGDRFSSIGTIPSLAQNGESDIELNYAYIHNNPAIGNNYYRLQQTDMDGKQVLAANTINLIRANSGAQICLYPNPASDQITLVYSNTKTAKVQMQVLDMGGRVMMQKEYNCAAGRNEFKTDLSTLATGVYQVRIAENAKVINVIKLLKDK